MAPLADGGFIVAGDHQFPPYPIIARRYDASVVPVGPAVQVNVHPPGIRLFTTAIAGAPNGDYTFAWYTASGDIVARSFDAAGNPITDDFIVNSSSGGRRSQPSLAYTSKNELIITWHGSGDTDPDGIYARRFYADGTPLGDEWPVNQATAGQQYYANLTIGPSDEVLISWTGPDANGSGVFARWHDAEGTPLSDEFQVNQFTTGNQRTSVFGGRRGNVIIDNQWVFTWAGDGPAGSGVYMTIFSGIPPEN